jgi:hypothetical protein
LIGSAGSLIGSAAGVIGSAPGLMPIAGGGIGSAGTLIGSAPGLIGSAAGLIGSAPGLIGSATSLIGSAAGCMPIKLGVRARLKWLHAGLGASLNFFPDAVLSRTFRGPAFILCSLFSPLLLHHCVTRRCVAASPH